MINLDEILFSSEYTRFTLFALTACSGGCRPGILRLFLEESVTQLQVPTIKMQTLTDKNILPLAENCLQNFLISY